MHFFISLLFREEEKWRQHGRDLNVEGCFAEIEIIATQKTKSHKRMNSELRRRQSQLLIMDFRDRMMFCKVTKVC